MKEVQNILLVFGVIDLTIATFLFVREVKNIGEKFMFQCHHSIPTMSQLCHYHIPLQLCCSPVFEKLSIDWPLMIKYRWYTKDSIDPKYKWLILFLVITLIWLCIVLNTYAWKPIPPDPAAGCSNGYGYYSKNSTNCITFDAGTPLCAGIGMCTCVYRGMQTGQWRAICQNCSLTPCNILSFWALFLKYTLTTAILHLSTQRIRLQILFPIYLCDDQSNGDDIRLIHSTCWWQARHGTPIWYVAVEARLKADYQIWVTTYHI